MKNKYLPIKIFEKRKEYDDRNVEAGGGDGIPNWVLQGEELMKHSEKLSMDLDKIRKVFTDAKERNFPIVIVSEIKKDAIAKSHRNVIKEFLNNTKDGIIGFDDNNKLLSIVENEFSNSYCI